MTNNDVNTGRQALLKEWDECTRMMLFEIAVTDIITSEEEFVIVNVSINRDTSELNFDFHLDEPFETEIDETLDYNLEGLYEAITQDRNFTEQYIQR